MAAIFDSDSESNASDYAADDDEYDTSDISAPLNNVPSTTLGPTKKWDAFQVSVSLFVCLKRFTKAWYKSEAAVFSRFQTFFVHLRAKRKKSSDTNIPWITPVTSIANFLIFPPSVRDTEKFPHPV